MLVFVPSLLLFGGAELATRAYIWYAYGKPSYCMKDQFINKPYVLSKTRGKIYPEIGPKQDRFRIVLLEGSTMQQAHTAVWKETFSAFTDRELEVINLADGGYILNQERVMLMFSGIPLTQTSWKRLRLL